MDARLWIYSDYLSHSNKLQNYHKVLLVHLCDQKSVIGHDDHSALLRSCFFHHWGVMCSCNLSLHCYLLRALRTKIHKNSLLLNLGIEDVFDHFAFGFHYQVRSIHLIDQFNSNFLRYVGVYLYCSLFLHSFQYNCRAQSLLSLFHEEILS